MTDDDDTGTPGRAAQIVRRVSRFLAERGENYITEFTLKTGRRVDVIDLDRKGRIAVVEVKSAVADFRSNRKWFEYLEYCDIFSSPSTRISHRRYCRPTAAFSCPMPTARRKAVTLRFARASASRLLGYTDPNWIRGSF